MLEAKYQLLMGTNLLDTIIDTRKIIDGVEDAPEGTLREVV